MLCSAKRLNKVQSVASSPAASTISQNPFSTAVAWSLRFRSTLGSISTNPAASLALGSFLYTETTVASFMLKVHWERTDRHLVSCCTTLRRVTPFCSVCSAMMLVRTVGACRQAHCTTRLINPVPGLSDFLLANKSSRVSCGLSWASASMVSSRHSKGVDSNEDWSSRTALWNRFASGGLTMVLVFLGWAATQLRNSFSSWHRCSSSQAALVVSRVAATSRVSLSTGSSLHRRTIEFRSCLLVSLDRKMLRASSGVSRPLLTAFLRTVQDGCSINFLG
mmetsp:Transcript_46994/g.124437  ORF Transcript_46994/g.124437 Transcript_46994/m.124437 type:complete len:278 (-) Transcript_46994:224-1057(-)